jgi:hypothetical protein
MTLLVAKVIAGDRWMDMEHYTDMGKLAYFMETLFQGHFVHHKSHWWAKTKVQAGLLSCQGFIPEKCHTNQTQNSHLKRCISWGLRKWQPHPVWCTTIPLVDIQTCRVYMYFVYSIYTFLYNIFISNAIKIWDSHPQFLVQVILIVLW